MKEEKEELEAKLIYSTDKQRYFKLNRKITRGYCTFKGVRDFREELFDEKNTRVKEEYREIYPSDGFDVICISDANTHLERLVFGACIINEKPSRSHVQIEGKTTFMIHGGDRQSMKADEVYLRRLAQWNGLKFSSQKFLSSLAENKE
jgi:hypothetical protein